MQRQCVLSICVHQCSCIQIDPPGGDSLIGLYGDVPPRKTMFFTVLVFLRYFQECLFQDLVFVGCDFQDFGIFWYFQAVNILILVFLVLRGCGFCMCIKFNDQFPPIGLFSSSILKLQSTKMPFNNREYSCYYRQQSCTSCLA